MARNKHPEETVQKIIDTAGRLFLEQGYENTSIQDIINNLGGLSKGAIYHHFKSKDEIFQAVCSTVDTDIDGYYRDIRDDASLTGYEKLKRMLYSVYNHPRRELSQALVTTLANDPKFIAQQIFSMYNEIIPRFVQPVIEQGVQDGSIVTDYPKQLAEIIMVLCNLWINPLLAPAGSEELLQKLLFLRQLLQGVGLDIFDDTLLLEFQKYVESLQK